MRVFLLQTPFYRILIAFILGILLFECSENIAWLISLGLLGFATLSAHHILVYKKPNYQERWLFGLGILALFIGLGFFAAQTHKSNNHFPTIGKQGIYKAKILTPPEEKAKSYLVSIQTTAFANNSIHFEKTQGKALLFVSKTTLAKNLKIGDEIIFSTTLNPPQQNTNPAAFNYAKYLERKGILASGFVHESQWKMLYKRKPIALQQVAFDFREKLLTIYQSKGINGNEFGVLAALTLGYKKAIDDDLFASYSNSGALHILSVSGLHVGIVFLAFSALLSFLNKNTLTRLFKGIIVVLLLWAYAFITGLAPSVVRASVMFSLIAISASLNYKVNTYNSIFFSAFLLLLYDTNYLFNISFLLSYSAVLSIVFFQPRLKKIMHFEHRGLRWTWDLLCVSTAAQIGTFPIAFFFFQKFSTHFLLTNLIAIPLATIIIYMAVALLLLSSVTVLSNGISLALNFLLKLQNKSITTIDNLPFATFETYINGFETALLYLLIVFITLLLIKKKFHFVIATLLCVISLQLSFLHKDLSQTKPKQVIVYAHTKDIGVDLINKNLHYFYASDSIAFKKTTHTFWLKNKLNNALPITKNKGFSKGFFVFHGKRFCIIDNHNWCKKTTVHPLPIDYLIISKQSQLKFNDINRLFAVKTVILNDTFSTWEVAKFREKCNKVGINCYSTKEKGCLTINL